MDDVAWGALALTLTLIGGAWTWWAFRNRGVVSGVRGTAVTLLPAAAYLTGTLELAGEIGQSVTRWATNLVFNPVVWLGIVLAGLSLVLLVVAGLLPDRHRSATDAGRPSARKRTQRRSGELPPGAAPRQEPAIDDDLAEIEALLRKRGIQ